MLGAHLSGVTESQGSNMAAAPLQQEDDRQHGLLLFEEPQHGIGEAWICEGLCSEVFNQR